MSKAVLVMDMPEQTCEKCQLCYETADGNFMCAATGKEIADGEKPEWCPLVQMPEKKESDPVMDNDIDFGMAEGWNACIDAITGEREEKDV